MSTTITLTAAANAAAAAATVTVTGTTPSKTASATFKLAVRGTPGTLDMSWGTGGVTKGLSQIGAQATAIGFQKSGLPVVGGTGTEATVVRYTNAGVLDATFGTGGKTYLSGGGTGVAIDSTDRIYQCGGSTVRYTSSGSPDSSWGTGGAADRPGIAGLNAVALDLGGRLLIAGRDTLNVGAVYRSGSDGSVDSTWGVSDGHGDYFVSFNVQTTVYTPLAMAVQSVGRIIEVGHQQTQGGPSTNAFVSAATSTGSRDTNFGTTGLTLTANEQWLAVALQKDDSIVAAGFELPTNGSKFSVARYTAAGAVDVSFNDTGLATFAIGDGMNSQVNGVAVQSDGKIILAGDAESNGRSVMAVIRLDSKGALDPTFGPNAGIVLLPVATTTAGANAVAVGPDGMIYVVGHGDNDWAVARFWP